MNAPEIVAAALSVVLGIIGACGLVAAVLGGDYQ